MSQAPGPTEREIAALPLMVAALEAGLERLNARACSQEDLDVLLQLEEALQAAGRSPEKNLQETAKRA